MKRQRTDDEMRMLESAAMEAERISAACEVFFGSNDYAMDADAWSVPAIRRAIRNLARIQQAADNLRDAIARSEGV